ncbi:hypothetical protein F5144DRAFT_636699 [Chaetomium tenue]|uniref:Uncharacterized protein n=1 Tax=Chaetomium tenue TaxID=1854479 RepID=A0ACB7PQF6_9PEZI|nr:hypothetical protein F5144DRAFT_636699 [Chaetomium globosum]
MNRLTTAFALLPVAFATPFLQRAQTVNVVLRVNKVTSDSAIDVWNESKSEVLAQACSRSLKSGSFESSPILFTVDEYGAGTLSIGTQTYTIHDDPDVSGGIICGRIASPSELAISCDVLIPESLQLRSLSKRDTQDCFAGSPVEAFEEPMECGFRDGCEIGYSNIRSFSIGWSASLSAASWITGGFAVESSIETGNQFPCRGEAYDYFAVWKKMGQTAYTVQNGDYNQCSGFQKSGSPFVMWSPNTNNRGGNFYCVFSQQYARNIGDQYIDKSDKWPGGP